MVIKESNVLILFLFGSFLVHPDLDLDLVMEGREQRLQPLFDNLITVIVSLFLDVTIILVEVLALYSNLLGVSKRNCSLLITLDNLAYDTPLSGVTIDFATITI